MFVDTHCHLDHQLFAGHLPAVISESRAAGVAAFIIPGVDQSGWERIATMARCFHNVFPAYGMHPGNAAFLDSSALCELRKRLEKAVAVGEIGLDYTIPVSRELQQRAFRIQLRLAVEYGVPVLIHCRKAFQDLLQILKEEKIDEVGGVMHAFSGSWETARQCLNLGLHISLAGTVTYPNALRPVQLAARLPLERLLLETDAPDLTPVPHRGESNRPSHLLCTAACVATIRGIPLPELGRCTSANACRLFGLRLSQETGDSGPKDAVP